MAIPPEVVELVERFGRNSETYKRDDYKETRVRVEFIDPFFEALGWDVRNIEGYAEQYKDVVHEDTITIAGKTRAPDYSFRIGGARKFFLEAKKPSVDIKDNIGPAYQLRRYSWSVKLPIGILTDFEEFAVYDCHQSPKATDNANVGQLMYVTFDQYLDRFDEISNLFAKESVQLGSLDQFAQAIKKKRGTNEVDNELLKEIESWRDVLARNIAVRNEHLSVHELNFAVQRTIDRIIFLRMAEDRGIEDYGILRELTNTPEIYPRLKVLYKQADEKYNAGLFDFKADTLTPGLSIDDKVLKPILENLYYPKSPYEFSVMPVEILGQVYEQFLGKVIRLTPSHRAKVEEKPEVKKAGGVYYTPSYIVDYIVKQTVGQLIEGKSPKQVSKLRIMDPACGSGSFLLGAFQNLLDYHLEWYETHDPSVYASKKQPAVYQGKMNDWRLTSFEKKRILLNNIYGVDIDRQAVEVTKLSLLLQVLEGETEESLGQQLSLWRERALPNLGENIKCGNSLIGPDFFEAQLMPDEVEMRRVNPFDWQAEFREVMAAGGFNAVIGNPPYLFITELCKPDKDFFAIKYNTYSYRFDVYGLFIERAIDELLNRSGEFGFIIPHTLLNNDSFEHLRRLVLEKTSISAIIDLGPGVFQNAKNETMLLFFENTQPAKDHESIIIKSNKDLRGLDKYGRVTQSWFLSLPKSSILLVSDPKIISTFEKLRKEKLVLGDVCTINQGLRTGNNRKYLSNEKTFPTHKPVVGGKNIDRYLIRKHLFVQYEPKKLDAPRKESIFASKEKLIAQEVRNITLPRRLVVTYDDKQLFSLQTTNVINLRSALVPPILSLKYLLGLINSTLLNWFFRLSYPSNNHIASNQLAQLPIRAIDFNDPADVSRHDKMVALVERMLELNQKLSTAAILADKQLYQRQIKATDQQIDVLVYELYELTEEEIKIVENATSM